MPGELYALLERCRAEDAPAWERFAAWVTARGRVILRSVGRLSPADGDEALSETLKSLVPVVRSGPIRGVSNAEMHAYVSTVIRSRVLNVLRGRTRRGAVDGRGTEASNPALADADAHDLLPDRAPSQEAQAIAGEQLDRAERVLLSWPATDRYLFIAKLNGVSARVIQQTLEQPPFGSFTAVTTIDTRFHRLRKLLIEQIREP